jgi:hypothetical protein
MHLLSSKDRGFWSPATIKTSSLGKNSMPGIFCRISAVIIIITTIGACGGGTTPEEINDHATRYSAAWNSGDPATVPMFFSENGSLKVNNTEPARPRQQFGRSDRPSVC